MEVERRSILDILRSSYLFKSLNDDQLERVADRVGAFLYTQGQIIFQRDSASESFFFILSGKVTLTRTRRRKEEEFILEEDDIFGEEAISNHPSPRRVTATARSDVILLRLSSADLQELKRTFPSLEGTFRRASRTYNLLTNLDIPWKAPREVIRFVDRPHWLFLIAKMAPSVLISLIVMLVLVYLTIVVFAGARLFLVLLAATGLAGFGWVLWEWIDFFNDFVVITNRRVALLTKVLLFYDSRQEVPLDAVLSDDVRTTQFGRILGYGSIHVRTYTGEIDLDRLPQPAMVVDVINEMRERALSTKNRAHLQDINQRIDRIINGVEESQPAPSPGQETQVPVSVTTGRVPNLLSNLFKLRTEQDGVITYRTHWFILAKKTWLPALFNLGVWVYLALLVSRILPVELNLGLAVFVALAPAFFLWWLYQYVDWRNDCYIITQDTIVDVFRKPLGMEQKRSSPIRNILSIDFERLGIIGLLLNFGTVSIRVGEETFTFDNVTRPSDVQQELFQRMTELKLLDEEQTQQKIDDQLSDWIRAYHQRLQENQSSKGEDEDQEI